GDVTEVGNAGPVQVSGVGLVTDLEGTGGSPRGEFRSMLEKELRQRKEKNVSALLDSPNNALVLVTALIPAGCRRYDPIDVQVTLPEGSPATSLRGGYLQPCLLRTYETTKGLNPDYQGGNRLLQGHILGAARGPLLVGFGEPGEKTSLKMARIWEGGTTSIERPFFLILKKDEKSARIANAVATRINVKFPIDVKHQEFVHRHRQLYLLEDVTSQINETFEPGGVGRGDTAKAITKDLVQLRVPYAYRYNPERYLRVARLIPLSEEPETARRYRARLQKMLHDPRDCYRAALRLEALGKDSIPTLQKALDHEASLVRFAAAEALLYLGNTSGVDVLATLAADHPQYRAYALIALAGLNESVCRMKLNEMLKGNDGELRVGAFQALRLPLSEEYRVQLHHARTERDRDEATARFEAEMLKHLGGENLGPFWLHQLAPSATPAVHFAVGRRTEILIFGSDVRLTTPISVRAGDEFILSAAAGDERCFLSRINTRGEQRQASSLKLADVLRTLADLGGQYPEAVDLLRKLHDQGGVNCPVSRLEPPAARPLEELLAEGTGEGGPRSHAPIAPAKGGG
ncbi:MAG: flagellar basal body P-ring protein FlgI, partial [Gemmataceae bacterium]|nr:flagellar basal body P-ring protein FlgI [Gemmataceae bacterium]